MSQPAVLKIWTETGRDLKLIVPALAFASVLPTIYLCFAWDTSGAVMWSLAFTAIGGAVGFLFGIPRVLQHDGTEATYRRHRLEVNTNLEQISDWVTKILVGMGLVNLGSLPGCIQNMASIIAAAMVQRSSSGEDEWAMAISMGAAIIVYFTIVGFVAGYLMTRMFLSTAFARADRAATAAALSETIDTADAKIGKAEKSIASDEADGNTPGNDFDDFKKRWEGYVARYQRTLLSDLPPSQKAIAANMEIERAVLDLAKVAKLSPHFTPTYKAIDELCRVGILPLTAKGAFASFARARNLVVHKGNALQNEEVSRILELGYRLLRLLAHARKSDGDLVVNTVHDSPKK